MTRGDGREPLGVVVVDKPEGMTSFDVVAKIRKIYGTRRVGHTGTLDPMATGVLVILVGRAAKAADIIPASEKIYEARLRLGVVTDTEDVTGEVLSTSRALPSVPDVEAAARGFLGEYMQTPPMYSAKKKGGEKLYELARRGVTVEREPCRVEIYDIRTAPTERTDEYFLTVSCSGGTYIRTLCADIGKKLGCGGCMAALRRTKTCGFSLSEARSIEETASSPEDALLPTARLFGALREIVMSDGDVRRIANGQAIPAPGFSDGERAKLFSENEGFFAVGEVHDGSVRAIRQFVLLG